MSGVHAGQDCRLPCSALRQSFYSEPRICDSQMSVKWQAHVFSLKDREELRIQAIKRIVSATSAKSDTVNENQQDGGRVPGVGSDINTGDFLRVVLKISLTGP